MSVVPLRYNTSSWGLHLQAPPPGVIRSPPNIPALLYLVQVSLISIESRRPTTRRPCRHSCHAAFPVLPTSPTSPSPLQSWKQLSVAHCLATTRLRRVVGGPNNAVLFLLSKLLALSTRILTLFSRRCRRQGRPAHQSRLLVQCRNY